MIIKKIISWFKNKKEKKLQIKIDKQRKQEELISLQKQKIKNERENLIKKFNVLQEHYKTSFYYYCSKSKYEELLTKISNFKYLFFKTKNILTVDEKRKIQDFLNNDVKNYKNHEEFNIYFLENIYNLLPNNFFKFENISLDKNQIFSILKEDKINLVVAGAGSGKTTTILGKIKYLVEIKNVKFENILVLSYTNKAVNSLNEKVKQYLNYSIKIQTIHSFATSILSSINNKKPSINNEENLFKNTLTNCLNNNQTFIEKWTDFISYYIYDKEKDIDEELEQETIKKYQEEIEFLTLNGEVVKSKEELKIANFFFLNGINYEYEKSYEYDVATEQYSQYQPDFYLTDYKIYWEHFGVNKNNNTIWQYSSPDKNKKYQEGIEFKRKTHQDYNTQLIESFSYEMWESNWKELLTLKLKINNIILKPCKLSKTQINNLINENSQVKKFQTLFSRLLTLYEENNLNEKFVYSNLGTLINNNSFKRNKLFLEMFFILKSAYQEQLKIKKQLSYTDLIKNAIQNINSYQNQYQYIIIDEFQDISPLKMELINKILNLKLSIQLYLVGDDWQSIYGFNGSKVELFTGLVNHNDISETHLSNTYRNSQELINIASDFIKVDNSLLKKTLFSNKSHKNPIRIIDYTTKYNEGSNITDQPKKIANCIKHYYHKNPNFEFIILGRTQFWKKCIEESEFFEKNEKDKKFNLILKSEPKAKVAYYTAHGSKGLEADYTFVLDVSDTLFGFPSQVVNDPVQNLFVKKGNLLQILEERRLFYVAITRTKNITYLFTKNFNHSQYIDEIETFENVKTFYLGAEHLAKFKRKECPKCDIILKLELINGVKNICCKNYQKCNSKIKLFDVNDTNIICLKCNWIMIQRNGKFGKHYRCTNDLYCNWTTDVKKLEKWNGND